MALKDRIKAVLPVIRPGLWTNLVSNLTCELSIVIVSLFCCAAYGDRRRARWPRAFKSSKTWVLEKFQKSSGSAARCRAMSIDEFCRRYGIGRTTVYAEIKEGRLRLENAAGDDYHR